MLDVSPYRTIAEIGQEGQDKKEDHGFEASFLTFIEKGLWFVGLL